MKNKIDIKLIFALAKNRIQPENSMTPEEFNNIVFKTESPECYDGKPYDKFNLDEFGQMEIVKKG